MNSLPERLRVIRAQTDPSRYGVEKELKRLIGEIEDTPDKEPVQ